MNNTIETFLNNASKILFSDNDIIALCAGGSWISQEIDQFSDLDLIIISQKDISESKNEMISIANKLGNVLSCFTGEHVGEKRLLICLYSDPLLHVDLKFVNIIDFDDRIENPIIIWEKNNAITSIINRIDPCWPNPDYQWVEDRFWVWIHYAATKIGRGEFFEAIEMINYLRSNVLGPLSHIKNKSLPRGVRKLEFILEEHDLSDFKKTVPAYSIESITESLLAIINQYKKLRSELFDNSVIIKSDAEKHSVGYLYSVISK